MSSMFIIFGSPRSGTTLLASTLHQNDRIVIPDETDFIIPTAFLVDRVKDAAVGRPLVRQLILSADRTRRSLGEYLSEQEVAAAVDGAEYSVSAIVSSIYQALARKLGKAIAGDKSPNDLLFLRIWVKMGFLQAQDIKVVHLVRDVRDVVLSLQKMDWGLEDVVGWFPRFWNYSNLYLHDLLKSQPERYCFLRYEGFVADPRPHLVRLCQFLGVPFQDRMLDHTTRGPRYAQVEAHRNLKQPFLPSRAGLWQGEMDETLRSRIEQGAGEGLRAFGYPSTLSDGG